MKELRMLIFIGTTLFTTLVKAQQDTVKINKLGEFEYSWTYSCYTSIFDLQGDPYIYSANAELGLVTFNISDIQNPIPVDTIWPAALNGLKLMNISQFGDYLFGSLGSFQGSTQDAGLVIFDVTVPNAPVITDIWDSTAFSEGSAIAITDGQYAYLGAMTEGFVILDVSNVNDIQYVSDLLPFVDFPEIPGLFSVPNARGLALKNADTLMVAYDAGGLRMIDVTDKFNPVEIGMYARADIEATSQSAYNNIVIIDNYAYIPVDYCGLIVVDISDPVMQDVNWIDPWDCGNTNWDGAAGHTNQIVNIGDSLLFVSGADSEILVYDVTDKTNPVLTGKYVYPFNYEVSWGIDVRDNYIVTAMVDNPFGVPYDSDWGGIQLFDWSVEFISLAENKNSQGFKIYPNPANDFLKIEGCSADDLISIRDVSGKIILSIYYSDDGINISALSPGMYFVQFNSETKRFISKLVVE